MRGSWLLTALAASTACTGAPAVLAVSLPSPVVVGGTVELALTSDDGPVTLRGLTFDPPGILEQGDGERELVAIAEGATSAVLTVELDGEIRTVPRYVEALVADRVAVTPSLRGQPCAAPVTYTVGVQTDVPFELRHGDTPLFGEGVLPFLASGLSIEPSRSGGGVLRLAMPGTPGTATLTSPIDPGFALAIEIVSPAVIDELTLGAWSERLPVLGVASLPIDTRSAGLPVCADTLSRTITTMTPATCLVLDARGTPVSSVSAPSLTEAHVRGIAAGACTISVSLAGTPLTATTTLAVAM